MIHKHVKLLPHHPKRVIVISLIVALAVGTFGYIQINKKVTTSVVEQNSNTNLSAPTSVPSNLTLGFLSSGRIKNVSVKTGDIVKKDQVLAELEAGNTVGALTQARAAYAIAKTNLAIVLEQASASKDSLVNVTAQQDAFVKTAYDNLLSSKPEAVPSDDLNNSQNAYTAPVITGNYTLGKEGTIHIRLYSCGGGICFKSFGLTSGGGVLNGITAQPIGDSGLYIRYYPSYIQTEDWNIEIPNKRATDYLINYNTYKQALKTREKAIADAQANVGTDGSSSMVDAKVAQAESQINNALGAVQIAEAAYKNTIITAPTNGTITSVAITAGQIAVPNAPAIELKTNNSLN